ncbi:MAG: SurA N-terminal domain-containing protein [Magnetococcales bacterium]|nr:SurA N-terminal domain-containing protein [Magnetococcales bacterium]
MLSAMRLVAKSWASKILFSFLALTFVVWGVGDYVNRQETTPLILVGSGEITTTEFARAYEDDLEQLRRRAKKSLDKETAEKLGLKQRTVDILINRQLIHQAARELRLAVSAEFLQRVIATDPNFSRNGAFDPQLYEALLRQNHLNPADYEARMVHDLRMAQLEKGIKRAASAPSLLVEDLFRLENERRSASLLTLDPAQLEGEVKVTEEALQKRLEEQPESYATPVRAKLRYVVLDNESVRADVIITPEEIKAYYDEHAADYAGSETRRARHILAKVDDPQQEGAAREKIAQAQARLKKGDSFAEVAKALSDDPSAAAGGDLGEFGRGAMVPEFEAAAFTLAEGVVSEPVRSEFGFHLIFVEKIVAAKTRSVDEATEEIKARIFEEKALELVYQRSTALEDQLFSSGDMQGIAKESNLRYRETGWLTRDEAAQSPQGIESDPKFLEIAFSTKSGERSALTELPDGRFFVVQVDEREESRPQTLAEARPVLEKHARQALARQEATKILQEALAALKQGEVWETAAKRHGKIKMEKLEPFRFGDTQNKVDPAVQEAVFKLRSAAPLHGQTLETRTGLALARLDAVHPADLAELEKNRAQWQKEVGEMLGEERFAAVLQEMRNQTRITIDQERLKKM